MGHLVTLGLEAHMHDARDRLDRHPQVVLGARQPVEGSPRGDRRVPEIHAVALVRRMRSDRDGCNLGEDMCVDDVVRVKVGHGYACRRRRPGRAPGGPGRQLRRKQDELGGSGRGGY